MMKRMSVILAGLLVLALPVSAQKLSVSTDLLGYAFFCTMNAEISYSVSQKWSLTASARSNPFTFRKDEPENQFQFRQQSYAFGARLWPWHTGSGWWFAGKLRYQEYNRGGLFLQDTQEGDRFGPGLYLGYTHMLARNVNIEFGVGMWGGLDIYRKYSCPVCGIETAIGQKIFILPDDLMISIAYVF